LTQVRHELRRRNYSISTERIYTYWLRQYFYFHQLKHPAVLSGDDVTRFLNHLAVNKRVSASSQSQALNALAFLYKRF